MDRAVTGADQAPADEKEGQGVSKILVITDAWFPQTNGVVRCWDSVGRELVRRGEDVVFLTPDRFWTLPMPSYPEIQLALAPIGAVAEFINDHEPDHVHVATEGPLGFQARLHCEHEQIRFTSSFHTRYPEYLAARVPVVPHEWPYAYLRWFHWAAEATLVPTRSILDELSSHDFQHLKLWTRGVDHALFRPGAKTCFADLPGPHLLYVGRLAVEKNVTAFLDLDVDGTKIVVGDGPQLAELQLAYPKAVFMGRQEGQALAEIYRSADVFVFPSKTDTFGNVMVEAMASGVPVAAYPVTGPVDVLTDPRCGAMDENLGQAVAKALTLSRSAARAHAETFTWGQCTDLFMSVLAPARGHQHRAA
jgi:glycosyltransferase involved in cell wall biosynthesis